jgi:hypothetical protein
MSENKFSILRRPFSTTASVLFFVIIHIFANSLGWQFNCHPNKLPPQQTAIATNCIAA